jgi:hypothetical protein
LKLTLLESIRNGIQLSSINTPKRPIYNSKQLSTRTQEGKNNPMAAALPGLGNAIKFLPTGTVFLYQFFSPILSNNGQCHTYNKYLTAFLAGGCGLCSFFSTFTDSYVGDDRKTHYGVVTNKGLWPSSESRDVVLSAYKLQFADFVHASFAIIVFAVVVLLDAKTVKCFYPVSESTQKTLLMVLPAVVGAVSSVLTALFPYKRHGIGYPSSTTSSQNSNSGGEIPLTKI